jgi:hypothetical protein
MRACPPEHLAGFPAIIDYIRAAKIKDHLRCGGCNGLGKIRVSKQPPVYSIINFRDCDICAGTGMRQSNLLHGLERKTT